MVMRLIGELRPCWAEWSLDEYRSLFQRLGDIVDTGTVTRYIRYSGQAGGRTELRFFGIETDSIDIPDGMVSFELGEEHFTLQKRIQNKPDLVWNGNLIWNWLDRSVPGAPVGEFTIDAPAAWTTQQKAVPLEFVLTANACFEKGRFADDDVRLVEYDPHWPGKFEEIAAWLRKTIPQEILLDIEHIGSTAIPGMPAKPVIDILLDVPSYSEARCVLVPIFNKPEYEYWEYEDHLVFIKRQEFMGRRTHHIHAAPAGRFW